MPSRWRGTRQQREVGFHVGSVRGCSASASLALRVPKQTLFCWIGEGGTVPTTVRYEQRVAAGKATINALSIAPKEETIEIGEKLMQFRVDQTVKAINAALSEAASTRE